MTNVTFYSDLLPKHNFAPAVNLRVTKASLFPDLHPLPKDHFLSRAESRLKALNSNSSIFGHDAVFDWMYPEHFRLMSYKQWTPLHIARQAAEFLGEPGARVLDIGSGIGKFCLAAAHHRPKTLFHGVEQRKELIYFAEEAKQYAGLNNVQFTHANITQVNFKEFDHFYFYNSFYENVDPENRIDDSIETSHNLYTYYTRYLFTVLNEKPPGTRLATFHSLEEEIPADYELVDTSNTTLLKMWIKK